MWGDAELQRNEASGTVTWTLTSVAALSTNNLTFQVTVNAGDANGSTISNQGSFTDVNTPGCGNAATCVTNTVTNPVITPASISVIKSEPTPGAGVTVTAGQAAAITYQLAIANSGATASGSVTVTDAIPTGTTYVAASASCGTTPNCGVNEAAGTVTWTLTSVAALSTDNLAFQVTVNAGDANGSTISNQGSFTDVNTPGCGNAATCVTNTVTNPGDHARVDLGGQIATHPGGRGHGDRRPGGADHLPVGGDELGWDGVGSSHSHRRHPGGDDLCGGVGELWDDAELRRQRGGGDRHLDIDLGSCVDHWQLDLPSDRQRG